MMVAAILAMCLGNLAVEICKSQQHASPVFREPLTGALWTTAYAFLNGLRRCQCDQLATWHSAPVWCLAKPQVFE